MAKRTRVSPGRASWTEPFVRAVTLDATRIADRDEFPWSVPAIQTLAGLAKAWRCTQKVTYLTGENGTGNRRSSKASPRVPGSASRAAASSCAPTHPILMVFPGATIYELSEKGIEKVAYEKTEHFLITRDSLNHRDPYLKELFQES